MSTLRMKFVLATALTRYVPVVVASTCKNLKCQNGYQCVDGKKDYNGIFSDTILKEYSFFEVDNANGEYCDCGENSIISGGGKGMTGLGCTEMFEICLDDTVCFHGAPCLETSTGYVCDCAMTIYPRDEKFAGENCGYKVTDECDSSGDMQYDLSSTELICTNGGTCQSGIRSPVDMCDCPVGFFGHHCEFKGNAPDCDLYCQNGGICSNGIKSYDGKAAELVDHFRANLNFDNNMYCICPKGFTGPQCETQTSSCGNTECLNGGKCKITQWDEYFFCDCSIDDDQEVSYAGNHCQSESTTYCESPTGFNQEDFFCTNNGECPTDYWGPCSCPADYSGPRCEFLVQHHKDCSLECMNGGTCFNERPPESPILNFDVAATAHCKCPVGFTGNQCETRIELCDRFREYCLNGGKCTSSGDVAPCECPSGTRISSAYAGTHCEYIATSMCGDTPGSFCTNGGICGKSGDPGCTCVDGFHGLKCEFSHGKPNIEVIVEDIMWVYLLILLIVSFVFLLLICCTIRRNRLDGIRNDHTSLPTSLPEEEVLQDVQIT